MQTGEVKQEGDFKGAWLAVAQAHSSTLGGHQKRKQKGNKIQINLLKSIAIEEYLPNSTTVTQQSFHYTNAPSE